LEQISVLPSRSIPGFAGSAAHRPLMPLRVDTLKIRRPIHDTSIMAKPLSGPLRTTGGELISHSHDGARQPLSAAIALAASDIAQPRKHV
jgi:hypothetical protein